MNKKRHIIEDKFKFLVVEKNMIYNYVVKQGRIAYCFENSFGKFVYWEWPQFNEDGFEIQMKNGEKKKIEMLEHSPSVFQKYL